MFKIRILTMLLLFAAPFLAFEQEVHAADSGASSSQMATTVAAPARKKNFAKFILGGKLYRKNCAQCHGNLAQGDPNWRQPGANGKLPPPPLDGTGHAWHHPIAVLAQTIRNGTLRIGGSMPPWGGVMSDQEIDAVIEWFQSRWSDEIYQAWQERTR